MSTPTELTEATFGEISFVAKSKADGTATLVVPDFIRTWLDQAYKAVSENSVEPQYFPPAALTDEDARKENASLFLKLLVKAGATREAGILKVRQLPSKTMPNQGIRLGITADLPANAAQNADKPAAE